MARKLVVCLDGTGNEIGPSISNVLKLYRMIVRDDDQLVYYDPGVGTIGQPDWWSQLKQKTRGLLGLALGLGLDVNVLGAYSWLCSNYRQGDEIFLFGFSRGAYTARVVAGFIHLLGLLRPDQLNLAGYALVAYKNAADKGEMSIGWTFKRISGSRTVPIRFVGCWDTVSSLLVPRADRLYLPSLQTLPYTRNNPAVRTFRQAASIDERRCMYRLNHWVDPQPYRPDPLAPDPKEAQDIRQVWFAGVHSDVGGGYPEAQSGLSKYPLLWMVAQAEAAGLAIDPGLEAQLAEGGPRVAGGQFDYVPPSPTAELHKSLFGAWWLLEALPKWWKYKEWPSRLLVLIWFYFPWAEPRPIPNRPYKGVPAPDPFFVHSSVLARIAACPDYRPVNLPTRFEIEREAGPPPPEIPAPPYRPLGALARLRALFATMPGIATWGRLLGVVLGLLALSWLLDRLGLIPWRPDLAFLLGIGALAGLGTALVEEALFRGILLKPPPDSATGLGPALLSALVFMLWHPLQTFLYDPLWEPYAWRWWFLAGTFVLGFVCARLTLSTRSIWPAVVLHLLVALGWKTLYGIPSCGLAPCVLYQ
jgi:uncharacterized protein (DUF2235 family)/membrane protease YdiL (CAAX protease family)